MKRSLIIGRANVGKTLFCINFARYMGIRELRWLVERADGVTEQRRMSLAQAAAELPDAVAHHTRALQSILLEVPRGKSNRPLWLTDTTGLMDGIHPEPAIREAMAQTLKTMLEAHLILHMVDADAVGRAAAGVHTPEPGADMGAHSAWTDLDAQLAAYGLTQTGYLMLANKMDLPHAKDGLRLLRKHVPKHRLVPVSALAGTGFREVKQHVWRLA
ncbi:MAG: 50S ribosome-binding GTPase [Alicyclobacillaceae bacterium]|nr:50S ribosome-binding GTPase [Alicyclobacillaceae bacterium]